MCIRDRDWEGWQELTRELGGKVQLVGDDLFVTNTERLSKGIQLGCGNAILIVLLYSTGTKYASKRFREMQQPFY